MVYSWECMKCGEFIDREYKLSDEKPATIECECGGLMRRIFVAPAIKFKGEGFYSNDQYHDPNENPEDLK